MKEHLLISVRLHDGRYHATGEAHPSPARLFQALVAAAGLSGPLEKHEAEGLRWLERCTQANPPVVATPHVTAGQYVINYVPNNDLDAKQGDPRNVGTIRTTKASRPKLFDGITPFMFAWKIDDDRDNARIVCSLADRLYQFGRGIDFAWAWGEIINQDELNSRLTEYRGVILRPSVRGLGASLACPTVGSFDSLSLRYEFYGKRFTTTSTERSVGQRFRQPPKPRFKQIRYNSPATFQLFEFRKQVRDGSFAIWPQERAFQLVVELRDKSVERLKQSLPDQQEAIEKYLVGRKSNGDDISPPTHRARIIPILSIGSRFVDHHIRRALVEVPAMCPVRPDDVFWAFTGLEINYPGTREQTTEQQERFNVVRTDDASMLNHYGVGGSKEYGFWRTVTPAALPEAAQRRRIDPRRIVDHAKNGEERAREQARAAAAVVQAIRHAGISVSAAEIRVQREPFEPMGARVENFAAETRFSKYRLWHVEIKFEEPIAGPVVIGDGRFLGLGLMAPRT